MAHHRRNLIRLVLFLSPLWTTFAQSVPDKERRTEGKDTHPYSFCAIALANDEILENFYCYINANDIPMVKLSTNRRSQPIALKKKPIHLVFVAKDGENTQKPWKPLSEIAWPGQTKNALVLFAVVPSANGKEVRGMPIDDSIDAFPIHSTRILNLTGQELYAKIGNTNIVLPKLLSNPIPYPPELLKDRDDKSTPRFPLGLAVKQGQDDFKILYRGYTEAWLNARKLLIIRQNEKDKTLQVQELVDNG
ncbi:hypothetical protein Ga0100231_001560 [Opitutaceae bacterium TAV4]|nr:hypothetical protein Ga0100231_001560 [Opitutaceae bacterium TAV4]RRK01582.1 hypothetical protein Ga0100230_006950 [Opitutaceae bacterium TAV3]